MAFFLIMSDFFRTFVYVKDNQFTNQLTNKTMTYTKEYCATQINDWRVMLCMKYHHNDIESVENVAAPGEVSRLYFWEKKYRQVTGHYRCEENAVNPARRAVAKKKRLIHTKDGKWFYI